MGLPRGWLYAGVSQLARESGSYPECHWFESDRRYHRCTSLWRTEWRAFSIGSFSFTFYRGFLISCGVQCVCGVQLQLNYSVIIHVPVILYPIKWTLGSVKWTGTSPIYGHPQRATSPSSGHEMCCEIPNYRHPVNARRKKREARKPSKIKGSAHVNTLHLYSANFTAC